MTDDRDSSGDEIVRRKPETKRLVGICVSC